MMIEDDIKKIINYCKNETLGIFKDNLIGIYLFGSLTYGDFLLDRSDIDLMIIIKNPASDEEIEKIRNLHEELGKNFPKWRGRVECSFTPVEMFNPDYKNKRSRPYFGEKFYKDAEYGNEWIINNYLIQEFGVTLFGADFGNYVRKIEIDEVQAACLEDLKTEWSPKIKDNEYFEDPHNQSYFVLNLCRILYTVQEAKVGSKIVSANWVVSKYPQWKKLIYEAQNWTYGKKMNRKEEVLKFLGFVEGGVGRSEL